jgi:hypothetical protein
MRALSPDVGKTPPFPVQLEERFQLLSTWLPPVKVIAEEVDVAHSKAAAMAKD